MGGRELARFTTNSPLLELTLADLNGRGDLTALATTGNGSLLVLDADLQLRRVIQVVVRTHDWVNLKIVAVRDLDGDGQAEVLLSASQLQFVAGTNLGRPEGEANIRRLLDNSVIVLDHTLRPLARRVVRQSEKVAGFTVLAAPNTATGETDILALGQTVTVLRWKRR